MGIEGMKYRDLEEDVKVDIDDATVKHAKARLENLIRDVRAAEAVLASAKKKLADTLEEDIDDRVFD